MGWSIIFAVIRQTVDDEYENTQKKDQLAADRLIASSTEPIQGGLLAIPANISNGSSSLCADPKEAKEKIFLAVLKSLAPWIGKTVEDASSFARDNEPRKEEVLKKLQTMSMPSVPTDATSIFATNLWPSLKSRGWKTSMVTEGNRTGATRYSFKDKEVSAKHI
jgi:hypothetical protein